MDIDVLRDDLVEGLEHPSKGVLDCEAVSLAMRAVPRHVFVDVERPEDAYQDRAFEHRGTTVLAPATAAALLDALEPSPDESFLVVGAGVGYTAAVLAEVAGAASVTAVDLSRPLVWEARRNLDRAGYGAVFVDRRDGAGGVPEYAPYEGILVEAAAVEPPRRLLEQLSPGGRLVLPLGASEQELAVVDGDGDVVKRYGEVRFKPLLVEGEQAGGIERNRTARESRELAARAAERRRGWEHDWIDWDRGDF